MPRDNDRVTEAMKKLIKARYGGKTTELIKESIKSKAIIICRNGEEAHRIRCMTMEMLGTEASQQLPPPITYSDVIHDSQGRYRGHPVLIDNVEDFAVYVCDWNRVQLIGVTMSLPVFGENFVIDERFDCDKDDEPIKNEEEFRIMPPKPSPFNFKWDGKAKL